MPVRYGFIGCGAINQRRHLPEVNANPQAKVVAVCDIVEARAREVAGKYAAQAFTDYHQMLKQAEIDAVVIGVPNYLHSRMSVDALKSGRHVLVEKPMATTRAEGKAIISAAKQAKKFVMVGQSQRLMPPHIKAKELLDAKVIGKIIGFRSSFKHPGPDAWSVDGAKSWFFRGKEAVMGATGDLGVHKVDLIRHLLGEEITEVTGFIGTIHKRFPNGKPIDVDDTANLSVKTASGTIGTIEASWTNYGKEDNQTIIYGDKGVMYLLADPEYGVLIQYSNGNREAHAVGAIATNTKQVGSGVSEAFTEAILKKKAPAISAEEGYRSMNVILTAMEAAKSGRRTKVAPL